VSVKNYSETGFLLVENYLSSTDCSFSCKSLMVAKRESLELWRGLFVDGLAWGLRVDEEW
jgi:hypothetical protein